MEVFSVSRLWTNLKYWMYVFDYFMGCFFR